MEALVMMAWFVASIFVAIALYFFILPPIKKWFVFTMFSIKIWLMARKQKDDEARQRLLDIAKDLKDVANGKMKDDGEK